jgi:predicted DNA-binding protein (MmcQ/YjbR family)
MAASRARSEGRDLKRLRALCLGLPETTEKEAWGAPTWRVRGKMFAMLDDHHHGAPDFSVWLKSDFENQQLLVLTDPAAFFVPPYQGKAGWIAARLDTRTDWDELAQLIEEAWERAAPPALLRARESGGSPPLPSATAPGAKRKASSKAKSGAARTSRSKRPATRKK